MDVQVQEDHSKQIHCPFCKGELTPNIERIIECPECHTNYHESCHHELTSCVSCFHEFSQSPQAAEHGLQNNYKTENQSLSRLRQRVLVKPTLSPKKDEAGLSNRLVQRIYNRIEIDKAACFQAVDDHKPLLALQHARSVLKSELRLARAGVLQGFDAEIIEVTHLCFEQLKERDQAYESNEAAKLLKQQDTVIFLAFMGWALYVVAAILVVSQVPEAAPLALVSGTFSAFALPAIYADIAGVVQPKFKIWRTPHQFFRQVDFRQLQLQSTGMALEAYGTINFFADLELISVSPNGQIPVQRGCFDKTKTQKTED